MRQRELVVQGVELQLLIGIANLQGLLAKAIFRGKICYRQSLHLCGMKEKMC